MTNEAARPLDDEPDGAQFPRILRISDLTEPVQGSAREVFTMSADDELDALRDAEQLSAEPFNMYDLYDRLSEGPLVRAHLINAKSGIGEAVELTPDDLDALLDQLGVEEFTFIDKLGRPIRIRRGCIPDGGRLIIFPDDLGDEPGKPRLAIRGEE